MTPATTTRAKATRPAIAGSARRAVGVVRRVAATLVAVLLAATILNLLALAVGAAPRDVYSRLFDATLASTYGLAQICFKATPLIFLGLAASFSFRAALLNIGLEGQLVLASLAMGVAGMFLPASLPGALGALLLIVLAAMTGAAFALIPAALKRRGAPEVMTTIMLNFVALLLASWLVRFFAAPESTHTVELAAHFRLQNADAWIEGARGTQLGGAFVLALIAAAAGEWLLLHTRFGFHLRALGESPRAAALYGVPTRHLSTAVFALSGALAGLGAVAFVLGDKGYHEDGFSGGIGFVGLAVALLAQNRPLAVVPAALLLGLLGHGALAINALVPKEITDVLIASAMIVILVQRGRHTWRRAMPAPEKASDQEPDKGPREAQP